MAEGSETFLHIPTTSDQALTPPVLIDVFLGDENEIKYYVEEMRRRHLAIVLLQGEDFILIPRKTSGNRCPFWRSEESQCSKPLDSRAKCYNTGWIGGYHSSTIVKIVIPPANRTAVAYEEGVRKEFRPRPWTIHTPYLNERDLLVQRQSGFRFEITNVNRVMFRGLPMHQDFEMNRITTDHYGFSFPVAMQ